MIYIYERRYIKNYKKYVLHITKKNGIKLTICITTITIKLEIVIVILYSRNGFVFMY